MAPRVMAPTITALSSMAPRMVTHRIVAPGSWRPRSWPPNPRDADRGKARAPWGLGGGLCSTNGRWLARLPTAASRHAGGADRVGLMVPGIPAAASGHRPGAPLAPRHRNCVSQHSHRNPPIARRQRRFRQQWIGRSAALHAEDPVSDQPVGLKLAARGVGPVGGQLPVGVAAALHRLRIGVTGQDHRVLHRGQHLGDHPQNGGQPRRRR